MRTRTWLTTPPGAEPVGDERRDDDRESYVPALAIPREPRVPGPHRRRLIVLPVVGLGVLLLLAVVVLGERAQQEDPSIPSIPGIADSDDEDEGDLPQ